VATKVRRGGGLLAALMLGAGGAAAADGGAEGAVHDLIGVLAERGVLDEEQARDIAARNAAWEARRAEARKPVLSFWGDLRLRYEGLFHDEDATGVERTNRHRGRYRLRLSGKAEINDHATVLFRFASGSDDPRSTNQSFGSGLDFDTDDLRIDRAYAHLTPFAGGRLGERGSLAVKAGKVPNPFRWSHGKDYLWDSDINLEGVTVRTGYAPTEGLDLFFRGGYYVIDENSRAKDPHLWGAQAGFEARPADAVRVGGRASWYHFDSLDPAFHLRGEDGTGGVTSAGGNLRDGLSGGVGGQNVQVAETALYVALLADTRWPVLLYGTWANNLTAEASVLFPGAGEEDTAWGAGVEVGTPEIVRLGFGYWHIEANAFPSQFTDSNLFDGRTNREGWAVYGSRRVWTATQLNVTAFLGEEIEDDVPPFGDSVADADRVRLQADLVFRFR